jgi:hypothetical protein
MAATRRSNGATAEVFRVLLFGVLLFFLFSPTIKGDDWHGVFIRAAVLALHGC